MQAKYKYFSFSFIILSWSFFSLFISKCFREILCTITIILINKWVCNFLSTLLYSFSNEPGYVNHGVQCIYKTVSAINTRWEKWIDVILGFVIPVARQLGHFCRRLYKNRKKYQKTRSFISALKQPASAWPKLWWTNGLLG